LSISFKIKEAEIELTREEAEALLLTLADKLGYKCNEKMRPRVNCVRNNNVVKCTLYEGGGATIFEIPSEILDAYISALNFFGKNMKKIVRKRDLAEMALCRFSEYLPARKHCDRDRLIWSQLYGSRKDYYRYFRVPLLYLIGKNLIRERKPDKIEILSTHTGQWW